MLAQWSVRLLRDSKLDAREQSELLDELGLDLAALSAPDATIAHDAACSRWERLTCDRPSDFGLWSKRAGGGVRSQPKKTPASSNNFGSTVFSLLVASLSGTLLISLPWSAAMRPNSSAATMSQALTP